MSAGNFGSRLRDWPVPGRFLAGSWLVPGRFLARSWPVPGPFLSRSKLDGSSQAGITVDEAFVNKIATIFSAEPDLTASRPDSQYWRRTEGVGSPNDLWVWLRCCHRSLRRRWVIITTLMNAEALSDLEGTRSNQNHLPVTQSHYNPSGWTPSGGG